MNDSTSFITGYKPIHLLVVNPFTVLKDYHLSPLTKNELSISNVVPISFKFPSPLYSPKENSLNPEFVTLIGQIIYSFFILFIIFQSISLFFDSRKKSLKSYTSTPVTQIFKYFATFTEIILLGVIYIEHNKSLIIFELVAVAASLISFLIEFRTSPIATVSSSLFWIVNVLFTLVIFIQDTYSSHKIYAFNGVSYTSSGFSLLLSLTISVLEVAFYKPGYDISNESFNEKISFLSSFTFSFIHPVIDKIYKTNDITVKDLPDLIGNLKADIVRHTFTRNWNYELNKKPGLIQRWFYNNKTKAIPSLTWAVFKSFSGNIILNLGLTLIFTALSYIQPFILQRFIQYFQKYFYSVEKPPLIIGYYWASVMFLVSVVDFVVKNQASLIQSKFSNAMRTTLNTAIYEKALKLSPESRKKKSTGDIINNISTDVYTIFGFTASLDDYALSPLNLVLSLILLYNFFKNAAWFGFGAAIILCPIFSIAAAPMYKNYLKMMKFKDERTSLVTEILTSAKSVKLYSWEKPMLSKLYHIRHDKELKQVSKIGIIQALVSFLFSCLPFGISCATFLAFTIMYKTPLTADVVFPALVLFDLLIRPMLMIPNLITSVARFRTSINRVSELLTLDEISGDLHGYLNKSSDVDASNDSVIIKNATFVWNEVEPEESKDEEETVESEHNNVALKDVNFVAKKSKLTCVVGKVGSGKTTLLRSILGEIPLKIPQYTDESNSVAPSIEVYGNVAYCPQDPWILNSTVKENILFGFRYEPEFYQRVVEACELLADFKSMPDGDLTSVGEKGISLSGGQKARISLARAVYSRADIYLLDDVLSAVDAHVGKALIKQILSDDGIIGDRTKILATNNVPVLHEANDIYLLSGGAIIEHGDFETVIKNNGELTKLIDEYGRKDDNLVITDDKAEKKAKSTKPQLSKAIVEAFDHVYDFSDEQDTSELKSKPKTYQEEDKKYKGQVTWRTFHRYLVACNLKIFCLFFICMFLKSLTYLAQKGLLTYWSNLNDQAGRTVDPQLYLSVYIVLGVLAGGFVFIGYFVLWTYCIVRGAAYFFNEMANSILRSPMTFFDTTPVGTILNRLTKDIGALDLMLPFFIIGFVGEILSIVITFSVIIGTLPQMAIVILLLMIVYDYYRARYIPSQRELRNLASRRNSPVLSNIQESLNGLDTIKAFGQKERFIYKNKKLIDQQTVINLVTVDVGRWLSMRLESISAVVLLFASIFLVSSLRGKHPIIPSLLGLIMNYALSITQTLSDFVKQYGVLQAEGVTLERVFEYCNLPSEAPMEIEETKPNKEWPPNGVIKFNDYSTAYREGLNNVLNNLSFEIGSKEKIGIVGRTGAGKSSLTLALFRIIEATNGNIEIDGIDTSTLGLHDLRHHLTIIPQDAHTIKASVRENLDPFGDYKDEELWKALELAHLKEHISKMETEPTEEEKKESKFPDELPKKTGLDAIIENNGSNLSSGQKQLLCLARALLNEKSRILVLDEATAAVDFQTDKIIQETLRSEFKDKTIITIAHRIDTIMDSDKILVLDKGKVAEFDTPQNLLKDKSSIFYSLSKEGGYIK
ncbi:unnamed protein product [Candida verbasci]|uniref:Uncharacterized protein n=1 Tax=Candida verbasci TaxID=1227364 RepID=A0A9W4TRQ3_9ASCO|nr:unnamed protein product [Candida verbasci]